MTSREETLHGLIAALETNLSNPKAYTKAGQDDNIMISLASQMVRSAKAELALIEST